MTTPAPTPTPTRTRVRRTFRPLVTVLAALVVVAGLGAAAVAGGDGSTVTRARLERSLPLVFSRVYVQQARLLGHDDVTEESLHATAMCDKHGPDVADVGPGGDWTCLMGWTDPDVPMPPEGYGKFELNVHSNDCWTAGGPSKLVGFLDITDTAGAQVTNPAFEFDGCFDPSSDDSATGVLYPSVLTVTSTTVTPDADGRVGLQVSCSTGSDGCRGSITASSGGVDLGRLSVDLAEESTATLPVPTPVPAGAVDVTFTFAATTGVVPPKPVALPVA